MTTQTDTPCTPDGKARLAAIIQSVPTEMIDCPEPMVVVSPDALSAIAEYVAKLEAGRDAALSRAGSLEKVLTAQTNLTDRLLTIVECMEQDIGCERPDVIWPLLGPINDQARALTKDQSND